jgi:hypothetical protein
MFDQLFESFRKAAESSMRAQQEVFKQWVQQWAAPPMSAPGTPAGSGADFQKRWLDSATEAMNKQRELFDAAYKSGIDIIQQTFRVSEAKSPEDYRRLVEELWRRFSDTLKEQSEGQLREFQRAAESWLSMMQRARPQGTG